MRKLIYLIIIATALISSCQFRSDQLSSVQENQISDTLKKIAVNFLNSWEPPFNPEQALILFTQSDDFYLVIDGFTTGSYGEWAEGVPNYMADDAYFFKSYKHEIKDIRTVVFSPEFGVVTITYIWDNITKDNTHNRVDGAITLSCRQEKTGWKIVHYHGSHGD